jgi:hypothetical protein
VLVVGVGTSYAAESALPGDPLYAVKVGLTEPIQDVLAISPVAKAEWNTEKLSRRLEEAATLAAKGHLSEGARVQIENKITLAAADFTKSVEKLSQSSDGAIAAASAQSNFEASLVGHERVLTALSINLPDEAPSIAPILNTVRVKAEETNTKRRSAERAISATGGESEIRAAATHQMKSASDAVKEIRAIAAKNRLQASTTAEASSSAAHMEQAIDAGEQKLQEGKYGEAFGTFQAALRAAQAVMVNLDAEDRLTAEIETTISSQATVPADPTREN